MALSQKIPHLQALLIKWARAVASCGLFLWDYLICLVHDKHTAARSSYSLMRRLYSLTEGKSSKVLAAPFQAFHPPYRHQQSLIATKIAKHINERGFYQLEATPDISEIAVSLHRRLSLCTVQEILQEFKPGFLHESLAAALESTDRIAARLAHDRNDVCLMPETWELVRRLRLREIAASYLSCDPILTSVDSWHVAPIKKDGNSDTLYSAAAQTYHFDMDWIRFLKVFINLTPASMESGPFEYVPFSHKKKSKGYFRDGRFEQLLDPSSEVAFAVGNAGSSFFADTSGIHRDGRASTACRQVLQIEFAVSSFGSKYQYDEIFKRCRDAVKPIKQSFPGSNRTFALF